MPAISCPFSPATLTAYPKQDGPATGTVLIFPGGGYRNVSPREAKPVADAFNAGGYHAFVLTYTVDNPPLGTKPLSEAAWAISYLREHAAELGVDPDKIAVCGFSAGGHLAGSLGVHWHHPDFWGGEGDSARYQPNALILSYAVLSGGQHRHGGSFENLVGENPRQYLPWSLENQVSPATPPTFLWHTAEDQSVPVENSLLFAAKLAEYQIPFEMHVFPFGGHGLSVATEETATENLPPNPHVAQWITLCIRWLDLLFA